MTDATSSRLRMSSLGLAGAALGFGLAVSAFLGPLGWLIGVLLVAALWWLIVRVRDQGGRRWLAVGVGAVVGVLLYLGLALVQSLTADPESGFDDSDAAHRPGIGLTSLRLTHDEERADAADRARQR